MSEQNEVKCPACERGEKTITPPHSSVVGALPVHAPSGNICLKGVAAPVQEAAQPTKHLCNARTSDNDSSSCFKPAIVEDRGLHYCEKHGRERGLLSSESPTVPSVTEQSEQSQTVNYLQQLQGGMCFVHGRYKEGFHCPHWNVEHPELSTCLTEPQQYGPNPGTVLIPKVAEQYQAEKSDVELLEEAAIAMAAGKSAGIPKCPTCGSDNPKRPYACLLINGRNKFGKRQVTPEKFRELYEKYVVVGGEEKKD